MLIIQERIDKLKEKNIEIRMKFEREVRGALGVKNRVTKIENASSKKSVTTRQIEFN